MTDGYEHINVGEIWYIQGTLDTNKQWTVALIGLGRPGGHSEGRRVLKLFGIDYEFKLRGTKPEDFIKRVNDPY